MNWVICPVRNNLHLTKRAIKSFLAQDIGNVRVLVLNNASTDGTTEWLNSRWDVTKAYFEPGLSVAASWNMGLKFVFGANKNDHALVVNNDVELRPDTYRRLVEDGGGFVTAVGSREKESIEPAVTMNEAVDAMIQFNATHPTDSINYINSFIYPIPNSSRRRPHPDFSCFLIRRRVYEEVGEFDENFKMAFVEDQDMHVRLHKAGIEAYCLDLPFYHHGSATIKNADEAEVRKIQKQADLNRKYFKKKHGVEAGSAEYYALFGHPAPEDQKLK